MKSLDLISLQKCCGLLKMSRPTFNKRRNELNLTEVSRGRSIFFKKSEILNKLYTQSFFAEPTVNLVQIQQQFDLANILVDKYTVDLRRINVIDPYGVISLLCYVLSIVKLGQNFFFITPADGNITSYLCRVGFFKELKRKYPALVHWDEKVIDKIHVSSAEAENIFLPLIEITFRGQERTILDGLLTDLLKKGFSEEQAGYIGWIMGELSDNSLTHAKGPCYIMFSRYLSAGSSFLEIVVGDSGIGIYNSLLSNEKYKNLNSKQAFLKAFQSQVSSWPDSAKRGKGLCDLLTIALGNKGYVRSDTNDLGLFFNFTANQRSVEFNEPLTKVDGTRFSIILFESEFVGASREEIDSFLNQEIQKYE